MFLAFFYTDDCLCFFVVVIVTGVGSERGEEQGYYVERNGNCEGTGMGMVKKYGFSLHYVFYCCFFFLFFFFVCVWGEWVVEETVTAADLSFVSNYFL